MQAIAMEIFQFNFKPPNSKIIFIPLTNFKYLKVISLFHSNFATKAFDRYFIINSILFYPLGNLNSINSKVKQIFPSLEFKTKYC